MTPPSPPEENPASAQILVLFICLIFVGLIIIGNTPRSTPEALAEVAITLMPIATATITPQPDLFSNPQINASEVPEMNADSPAMPVAMFNLENPNGWETPETVTLVGTFQTEVGCEEDDRIDCDDTNMSYDATGDIWRASYDLPAGTYAYRAHLDKSETHLYGANGISGENSFPIEFTLESEQTVNFYYDHKTGWITDDINSQILTLPGNFQNEVGCPEEWDAGCFRTWMQDLEGDGIYTYETLLIPGGSWETRVALNGDLDTSYGQGDSLDGDNIPLWIPNIGHLTVFTWDSNLKTLTIFVSNVPIRLSTDLPPIAPNE